MKPRIHAPTFLLSLLILLLVVPCGWAQKNNRKQAEAYYQQALDALYYNWPAQGSQYAQPRALFEKAMEADDTFAPAYARAVITYKALDWWNELSSEEASKKAWWAANKALELDPNLAAAHQAVGVLKMTENDMKGAEIALKKAVALDPKDFDAHREYASWFLRNGQYDKAEAEARKALELDPMAIESYTTLGAVYLEAGEYSKAVEMYTKGTQQCSKAFIPYQQLAFTHMMYGEYDKAMNIAKAALKAGIERPTFHNQIAWAHVKKGNLEEALEGYQKTGLRVGEGWVFALMGRKTDALTVIDELKQGANKEEWWNHWNIALIYLGMGDKDKALDWLESSLALQEKQAPHNRNWGWRLTIDNQYDPLRNEPRFKALIKKTGYTP